MGFKRKQKTNATRRANQTINAARRSPARLLPIPVASGYDKRHAARIAFPPAVIPCRSPAGLLPIPVAAGYDKRHAARRAFPPKVILIRSPAGLLPIPVSASYQRHYEATAYRIRHLAKVKSRSKPVNIPDDIIFELLARLPVKSLVRFTIVSKSWGSLIRGEEFAHRRRPGLALLIQASEIHERSIYLHRPRNPYTGEPPSGAIVDFRAAGVDQRESVEIVGATAEGLVGVVQEDSENFWIWNPSTRSSVNIAFGSHHWGTSAGFASAGQQYTVIRIVNSPIPTASFFNVNHGNWLQLGALPFRTVGSTCQAIVAGVPYWLLAESSPSPLGLVGNLAWFDLTGMDFKVEQLGWPKNGNLFCFGEIESGILGAIVTSEIQPAMSMSIFARQLEGGWVHKYTIHFDTQVMAGSIIGFYCLKDHELVGEARVGVGSTLEIYRLVCVDNLRDEELIAAFDNGEWGESSKLMNLSESLVDPPRIGN